MKLLSAAIAMVTLSLLKKAKRVTQEILRDKIFIDGLEDDEKLYEEICNELDEQGYSMAVEVNIYESVVDMED